MANILQEPSESLLVYEFIVQLVYCFKCMSNWEPLQSFRILLQLLYL